MFPRQIRNTACGKTLISSALLLSFLLPLILASPAFAQYRPPQGGQPPRNSTIGGRRGNCESNATPSLTALVPKSHIGQTVAAHPTFAWYVPNQETLPVEFYLYEYDANNGRRLVQQLNLESHPGIMTLTLPADQPGLEIGRNYQWQVVLLCNPNHPSNALLASSEIQRIQPPASLSNLGQTTDPIQQVKLYAEAGLWYDALGTAAINAGDPALKTLQLSLLEDLSQLENQSSEESVKQHSAQLKQVITIERQRS